MFRIQSDCIPAGSHERIETALRAALALKRASKGWDVKLHDEISGRAWTVDAAGSIRPSAASVEDFMIELHSVAAD